MKNFGMLSIVFVWAGIGLLAGCGSMQKDVGQCTDADCAREVTSGPEAPPKGSPGTITIKCGVFKDNAEVVSPCEGVVVRVFAPNASTAKAEMTLSGEKLIVPNIGDKETVNLNLTLKGCAKPNLLPGLKGGDARETYFKTPCK